MNLVQEQKEPLQINNDVIRILEETLAMARRGEIVDLAVSCVKVNGVGCNNFSYGFNQGLRLIGVLTVTQRDILALLASEIVEE